jgi:hypothetical protein
MPPVVTERAQSSRTESKEFPTLEETLPEPASVRRASEPPPEEAHEPFPLSRSPITARGPFAANAPAPPFEDIGAIHAALRAADGRDAILDVLLAGVRTVARKVALFVVKRDAFVGWTCTPELGSAAALRAVTIPLSAPSILAQAMGSSSAHLGRVLNIEAHAPLLAVMTVLPTEVAAIVVRIAGRPAVAILADELGDTMVATRRMEDLAQAAGEALARVLRHKRRE